MTDLRERLRQLGYGGTGTGTEAKPRFEPPPPKPRRESAWPIERLVEGEIAACPFDACFVAETAWPRDHAHGPAPLGAFHELPGAAVRWLWRDDRAPARAVEELIFVDTETTGLAGGTGTYTFLVGIGRFEGGGFRLRQFFMRDPSEERAMLHLLADELDGATGIVSFNGKAFDLPLIETRYLVHRLAPPLGDAAHLDLLHPARRLWRTRLESCSLGSLEAAILGVSRAGLPDVPGWLIPSLYFDYVRHGDARPLRRVFGHNTLDILTMVALTIRLARQFDDPFHPAWEDGHDLYGLGRAFEDRDEPERAALCYERALALDPSAGSGQVPAADLRDRVLERIGALYRRLQRHDGAAAIWERVIAAGTGSTLPYVELAKHCEHRLKQPARAAQLVERALVIAELRSLRGEGGSARERAELEHRLARLRRKAGQTGLTS